MRLVETLDAKQIRELLHDLERVRNSTGMPVEDQYVDSERPARHAHLCLLGDGEIEGGEPVFYVTSRGLTGGSLSDGDGISL